VAHAQPAQVGDDRAGPGEVEVPVELDPVGGERKLLLREQTFPGAFSERLDDGGLVEPGELALVGLSGLVDLRMHGVGT